MSTRSLTHVRETENGHDILCIYRQGDGYPEGMGTDLVKAIGGYKIVNGIGGNDGTCAVCNEYHFMHKPSEKIDHDFKPKRVANGLGCLAAFLVVALKDCVGSVYIYKPNSKDVGEQYEYYLWVNGKAEFGKEPPKLMLKIVQSGCAYEGYKRDPKILYSGPLDDFDAAKIQAEEEAEA